MMITFKKKFKYNLQGAAKALLERAVVSPGRTTEGRVQSRVFSLKSYAKQDFSVIPPLPLDEIKLHLIYFSKMFPIK